MTPLRGDIAHRTPLVMDLATFDELYMRAQFPPRGHSDNARSMKRALTQSEASKGSVRVRCDDAALDFIREVTPELARRWPAVFGDVDVPRGAVVARIANEAIGQTVAGVIVERDGMLRLAFESGAALIVGTDGALEWQNTKGAGA